MTTARGAARFLRALDVARSGVTDAEGVRHFPRGLVVRVPADESTATQWRGALAAALERNRQRFHLSIVEQNPGAGEALFRFDPAVAGLGLEPLPLIDSIENTLRWLPGDERGVHLRLDTGQIPDGELPDQGRLADLCRLYGAGTPVIEHASLTEGQWYSAERLEWRELEVPGSVLSATAAARLRYTAEWLENAGDRPALVACPALEQHGAAGFALLPRQLVPWAPSSGLEYARRMDGGLAVDRAPFQLLPARRIRAVVAEGALESQLGSVLVPFERRGARLAYLGAALRPYGTVLLMPEDAGDVGLLIAMGPGNTRWFASRDRTSVVGADPANEVPIPPHYLFFASTFRLGAVHLQVDDADEPTSVDVKHETASEPSPLAWALTPYRPLRLKLGTAGQATFELRGNARGGSRRSAALELNVKHRPCSGVAGPLAAHPMGSRFEVRGHRFAVEEVA